MFLYLNQRFDYKNNFDFRDIWALLFQKMWNSGSGIKKESSQIWIREDPKIRFRVNVETVCEIQLIYFCLFYSALKYKYCSFGLSYLPFLCSCVGGAAVLSHAGQLPRQQLSRAS
jgi:hypothetical protein